MDMYNKKKSIMTSHGKITKPKKIKKNNISKNLSEYKKFPSYIECESQRVKNYETHVSHFSFKIIPRMDYIKGDVYHHLLSILNEFVPNRIVLGCVAWFTDPDIINILSKAKKVMIIVNDENYATWGNGVVTKAKYSTLPAFGSDPFSKYWKGIIETPLNFDAFKGKYWEAVRCFGYKKMAETEALKEGLSIQDINTNIFMNPIMHAKTLVICDENNIPRWLWSGTINFTTNSKNNIERGWFFDDKALAMDEFNSIVNTFLVSGDLKF